MEQPLALGTATPSSRGGEPDLAACFDALPYYVLVVDARHRIRFANRAVQEQLGVHPAALLGAYCPAAIHGLDEPFPGCPLTECVQQGGENVERELHDAATGRWMLSSVHRIRTAGDDGEALYLHTVRDITDQKRVEEQSLHHDRVQTALAEVLRLSLSAVPLEEQLDAALEQILSIPWLALEARGAVLCMEQGALAMKASRNMSEPVRAMCARVALGECLCGQAAATRTIVYAADAGPLHARHYPGMAQHGHYCVPILSQGEVLGVLVLYLRAGHRDDERERSFLLAVSDVLAGIIQRSRAEEDRARLASAVEQAGEAIAVCDASCRVTYVNPALEKLTGRPRQQVLGGSFESLWAGRIPAEQIGQAVREVHSQGAWSGRVSTAPAVAPARHYWMSISRVRSAEGVAASYACALSDITQEVELEARLWQAQKMDALGRLAGGVAHDFNNLLSIITGYSGLIRRSLPPRDALRGHLDQIEKAVGRGAGLTQQLLAFSRNQAPRPECVDLNALVADMLQMLERLVGDPFQLEARLRAPEPSLVRAGRSNLEQVILNLVVNARDAMPGGGPLIVETGLEDAGPGEAGEMGIDAGRYVTLTVSDRGVGMSPEVRERIFEPFFTTKEAGKGTGLGLATVYGIVRQARGGILVRSEVQKGSAFKVFLPVVE